MTPSGLKDLRVVLRNDSHALTKALPSLVSAT
jgi:hypothetical protein